MPGRATLRVVLAGIAVTATTGGRLGAAGEPFVEISREVGIAFVHRDGRSGEKYYVETLGGGGGWIDHDGDGDQDLYLVNGAATRGSTLAEPPRNALYENRGDRFVDVTEEAGVGDTGFGMGFCAGDYDSDGRIDFLVTSWGPDRLFRNLGDGRFAEVGAPAGVADERWGTSCAFGDLDADGDLDLYVARYVNFSYENNPVCFDPQRSLRSYCRPDVFDGLVDSLFVNQGDGTFVEQGERRGIVQDPLHEKGLGVVLSDVDLDGDLDVYVANDTTANRLYVNDGRGLFEDWSLLAGVAFSGAGVAESGMGLDIGDVDGDRLPDLLVTNYSMESNTLYRNLGDLLFEDRTVAAGLASASHLPVGWGVRFFDYDNDGDLDLAVANGHVVDNIERFEPGSSYPQANQLFENDGEGAFRDVSASAGAAWGIPRVSRGLAVADWNDDGRLDVLVTNVGQGIDLFENRLENGHHWLGLALEGPPRNRFAIGARVELQVGERRLGGEVRSGGSFMTQSDLRLHFGLGKHAGEVTATIVWPDGRRQEERTAQIDRYWRIRYNER